MSRIVANYQPDETSPVIEMPDGTKWCMSFYDEGPVGQFANALLWRRFPDDPIMGRWAWTTPEHQPHGSFFEHWDTPSDFLQARDRHGGAAGFMLDFQNFTQKTIIANTGFAPVIPDVEGMIDALGAWMLRAYPADPRLILAQAR